jgi:hypothetical protein
MQQLWRLSAVTSVEMLQKQQVTPLQLVEASEARWKVWQILFAAMAAIDEMNVLSLLCGLCCCFVAAVVNAGPAVFACTCQETDPLINAMPITCWEQAKEKARQMQHPENPPRGYLYGK